MGIDQGFGDGNTGEGIGLNENVGLGGVDLLDHGFGAAALRAEIDFDGWQGWRGFRRLLALAGGEDEEEQGEGEDGVHGELLFPRSRNKLVNRLACQTCRNPNHLIRVTGVPCGNHVAFLLVFCLSSADFHQDPIS